MSDCGESEDEERLNTIDTTTIFKYRESNAVSDQVQNNSVTATPVSVVDDDNHPILSKEKSVEDTLKIEHSSYTDIDFVGLQVWNGAVLLAEFIIFKNHKFKNKRVLELGSGTGLVSIIAAKYCGSVTCTDLNNDIILKTIERNFQNNRNCLRANYRILPFDFSKEWNLDVETAIREADIILASELVYDNEITENLIRTLVKILKDRPNIFIYLSVEKRYVFTLSNKKVEAVHYEYFLNLMNRYLEDSSLSQYKLNQITKVPRYFYEYERCNETELWCISRN